MAAALRDVGHRVVQHQGGPLNTDRLVTRFGPEVLTWVDALPELVDRLTKRWDLTVVRHLPGGTSHTLLCHRCGTTPVVLKLTPDPEVAVEEHAALAAWASSPRMVALLDADLTEGALLLEGLEPGTPARDQPAPPVVDLLNALHLPPVDGFRPLRSRVDYVFDLLRRRRPDDLEDVERGRKAALALADDPVPPKLLHGDLHQENVLHAGPRGLVAIDPRPCVGDPATDAVDFAFEGPNLRDRIEALSGAVDGDRLFAWCQAFAVFLPAWQRVMRSGDG